MSGEDTETAPVLTVYPHPDSDITPLTLQATKEPKINITFSDYRENLLSKYISDLKAAIMNSKLCMKLLWQYALNNKSCIRLESDFINPLGRILPYIITMSSASDCSNNHIDVQWQ